MKVNLNAVRDSLIADYGDREGYVCLAHVYGRSQENPRGYYGPQRFFRYPDDTDRVLTSIKAHVNSGADVYLPTSLMTETARNKRTVPSNVVSFEVDLLNNKEHTASVLNALRAGLVSSGTRGHFHVRITLTEDISHDRLVRLGRLIYLACDVKDGGKWHPHDILRVPGTLNHKHDPPTPVRVFRKPREIDLSAVKSVLHEHRSLLKGVGTGKEHTAGGAIATEEIKWSDVPVRAQRQYRALDSGMWVNDRSRGVWAFLGECRKGGLTRSQTYYAATALDQKRAGVIADKYTAHQIEQQINKVYAMNTGNK
ncbi:hypothetical protein [Gordonia alkanivorans]|uniref:hypothetical protein n=1 Tax=Gordonia alkanivorans TaxID=84096 RepID=UPI0024485C6E|nr:hypothetical protein [Gordonia alkanivorans]MDH3021147.1 hypothetical protein [Gordonia alkanivorans]MDJ0010391.1 hypothetical protein [Gordonia alkanivorans]MDJ0099907.1 hypothetical protein [Gordonia alkanivorans]MDJ0496031.1 hypothetical protein [Gordonia alkanivorans]